MMTLMTYCTRCGRPDDDLSAGGHESCRAAQQFEPPRYCAQCKRRMVVQVVPSGWTARCSVHGEQHS